MTLSRPPWLDLAPCTSSVSASKLSEHPRPSDPERDSTSSVINWLTYFKVLNYLNSKESCDLFYNTAA